MKTLGVLDAMKLEALADGKKGFPVQVVYSGHGSEVRYAVICGADVRKGQKLTWSRDGYVVPFAFELYSDQEKNELMVDKVKNLRAQGKTDEEIADEVFG